MKRLLYIFFVIMALVSVSCVQENFPHPDAESVPDGYVKIEFKASIVDPTMLNTRAVDPDGLDVNNMTLFCFNEFGLFISTQTATIRQHTPVEGISDSGTYEATIPSHTHIIHFLGNHSAGLYDPTNFPGQTESMVIANMEGGSGMLVYWSRFKMDSSIDKDISEQLADLTYKINETPYKGVKLIRNQAKVTVSLGNNYRGFVVTGFRTVNIPAFGTVAPHHPQRHFEIVKDWETLDEFITLPDNQTLMSDIIDINTKSEDYIFETENSGDKQVSVIIKGHAANQTAANDKYYRIVLQNDDGSNFMIRRNHHYNVQITGMLTYGCGSFEEALVAPASNNAWISIDEWVNEISDGVQTLWVEKTSYVLSSDQYAGTNLVLPYKYTKNGAGDSVAPTVTWIENNLAYSNITNDYDKTTGKGNITLRLYPMYEGNEQQVGSILIKHGKLQRKITIYVIRTQNFTPSWISSQVYGDAHEYVTLMFTIPDTCPDALFPFTVLISANHLDVRSESGQQLPLYIKGEEGYFGQDWEGINYKYAYTVTGPGKHRLHMHSILQHEDDDTEDVHLEADFFQTITKQVVFRGYGTEHRRIFVEDLFTYHTPYAQDEHLYYILLPQKKAAPIMFNFQLQKRGSDGKYSDINHAADSKNANDEFLIYSKYLSLYDEYFEGNVEHYGDIQDNFWELQATSIRENTWSTNGRVMGVRTYDYKSSDHTGLQTDGNYNLYLLTNDASSTDVIRMSSNNTSNVKAFAEDRNGNPISGTYEGNEYLSLIFDVGRYSPYRFAAQVKVSDSDGSSSEFIPEASKLMSNPSHKGIEEEVDDVMLSYKPGQRVDILLDITSFTTSTIRSVHPFGEKFGEEFDVYIDAPMLEIDYIRVPDSWLASKNPELKKDKLRKHESIAGRYVYTVDRYRAKECEYGIYKADDGTFRSLSAHNDDYAKVRYDEYGRVVNIEGDVNQEGERKLLPFVKNAITVGGDIFITTDKTKVIYWDKTFHVDTKRMAGTLRYQKDGVLIPVPQDAFIAFVRMRTGARIGVVTLSESGKFELDLRDEYTFAWENDPIDFYYKDSNGIVYSLRETISLADLYRRLSLNDPITLYVEQESDSNNQ